MCSLLCAGGSRRGALLRMALEVPVCSWPPGAEGFEARERICAQVRLLCEYVWVYSTQRMVQKSEARPESVMYL